LLNAALLLLPLLLRSRRCRRCRCRFFKPKFAVEITSKCGSSGKGLVA